MKVSEFLYLAERHRADAMRIAALLRQADTDGTLARRADRITSCATFITGYECPECGEFHVLSTRLCRDRLCPICGWVLARRRYYTTKAAVDSLSRWVPLKLSHAVLTLQHSRGDDLRANLRALTQGYGRLLQTATFRKRILGTARAVELTHGVQNGFHPHIHDLIAEPRDFSTLTAEHLQSMWKNALRVSYEPVTHLKEAYSNSVPGDYADAIAEACKYAIKPGAVQGLDVGTVAQVARDMRGVRLTAATGALRADIRAMQATHIEARREQCASCGSDRREHYTELRWNYLAGSYEHDARF